MNAFESSVSKYRSADRYIAVVMVCLLMVPFAALAEEAGSLDVSPPPVGGAAEVVPPPLDSGAGGLDAASALQETPVLGATPSAIQSAASPEPASQEPTAGVAASIPDGPAIPSSAPAPPVQDATNTQETLAGDALVATLDPNTPTDASEVTPIESNPGNSSSTPSGVLGEGGTDTPSAAT